MLPRRYGDVSSDAKLFYAQLPLHLQATETMSRSNSTSTFHHNDRVEALRPEDGKWYPARVCKVLAGKEYRIRFDGFPQPHDCQAHQMRVPTKGNAGVGGGNQRPSAKQAAPAPSSPATFNAETPSFAPPSSGISADALRLFEAFMSTVQRPSHAADHYAALQLAPNCGVEEIKRVQKGMSLDWHTDRAYKRAEDLVPAATERRSEVVGLVREMLAPILGEEIRFLNHVKDDLTDAKRRREYDAEQAARFAAQHAPQGFPPQFPDFDVDNFLAGFWASGATSASFSRTFTQDKNGFTEQHDYQGDRMRVPKKGGAKGGDGNQRPSAKQAAPAPAQTPISDPSSSGPRTDGANKSKRNQSDKRKADLAEHQDPVVSAQMHQAELSAAARIAELEEQVRTLTANKSSCEAAAASARSEAENAQRDLLASRQKVSDLRERIQRQEAEAAGALGELKAGATKLKVELCSSVLKTIQAVLSESLQSLEPAAADCLHQAVAAAQVDDQSSDEPVQALVSEKLRDSAATEEQVKQALAVQQCGA